MQETQKENDKDFFEERAAILEYAAGLTRVEAERKAFELLQAKKMREQNARMRFG